VRKTVASAGKGSRDEAHDREKGIALIMGRTKEKHEQQLGLEASARLPRHPKP
jgi:hypothetical protein